jgi:glycosyltransferase involved in cell wall biosynthesis
MFNTWDAPITNDKFISIVILSYTRPKYLKNLLQSIHQHADMPFEIIVNDDASGRDLEVEIFNECRHMCSTLIFGSPERINMGMAASCNRAIALANSKYILLLNDDTQMIRPGALRKIKQVLDVPYIGCFGPWQCVQNVSPGSVTECNQVPVSANGVDFNLSTLPNGAGIFAFRKEVWEQVRGFPQVYTNAGDTCFMIAAMKAGYFNASMFINEEEFFTNVDQVAGYVDPTAGKSPLDASYPHVFGIDNLPEISNARRERVFFYSHHSYYAPEGIVAHGWWDKHYFGKAYDWKTHSLDWNILEQFGHTRWRDLVERDMAAWRQKKNG